MRYAFQSELWLQAGEGPWTFLTPFRTRRRRHRQTYAGHSTEFRLRGVTVTVGATTWKTSPFRDTNAASYLLPVNKQVRSAEQLNEGDVVDVMVEIDATPSAGI